LVIFVYFLDITLLYDDILFVVYPLVARTLRPFGGAADSWIAPE
jgi:hypothetical protein